MKALRPDEEKLYATHSVFVDQWDWEQVISPEDRNLHYLKKTVTKLYQAIKETETAICRTWKWEYCLPKSIQFIHAEELRHRYPALTPKEREQAITRQYGAVFHIGIGGC